MTPDRCDLTLTHGLTVPPPGSGDPDFTELPPRRGVLVFHADDGAAVLILSSANVREMARRRLRPPGEAGRSERATDLRAITRRIGVTLTTSPFETEVAHLALARSRTPRTYRSYFDRRQAWFVSIDPEAAHPRWSKHAGHALHRAGLGPGAIHLGPIRTKHAAGRVIESLIDLFDLCREHHLLVQAPRATACMYKEMGKCPAPCDGSETMGSYRSRVLEACAFGSDRASWEARAHASMKAAAEAQDFEQAASIQRRLKEAASISGRSTEFMRDLSSMRYVAVSRGPAGWASLTLASPSGFVSAGAVRADADRSTFEAMAARLRSAGAAGAFELTESVADDIGLLGWALHLDRPETRFVHLEDASPKWLAGAARGVQGAEDEDSEAGALETGAG